MSRNELIEAYQSGRVSRRKFIRGMVAVGLSASAATAMADRLRAAPAPGGRKMLAADDVYTLPATGAGSPGSSASSWMKPMAVLGAGAALAAGALRRIKGGEAKAE